MTSSDFTIHSFDEIDSTSTKAKELAMHGAAPWTVVVAARQTNGYGRKGDTWHSPEGGLYFSIILPKGRVNDIQDLTLRAAAAVCGVINGEFKIESSVKPPNDVYMNGKKLCGILTENVILGGDVRHSIMGIGLNTDIERFPAGLEKRATSLRIELGRSIGNKTLLKLIVAQLQKAL
jgi:BirA family biotin operon repressor/biotin-[acetyl-CoA-carboxylase] ligase